MICRPLRSSDHGQVMINMSCALLCLYVVFVMSANATPVPALCGTSAALVHYFMLVYFMWTAVEAVFLYIKLGRILGKKKRRFTLKAGLVAWRKYMHNFLLCDNICYMNELLLQLYPLEL